MRIIAGSKRGMKLLSPGTQNSRPITDRVKESLFSVLHKYDLPGEAVVADLFAGAGSLGLEALSRGAEFVTFVENDPMIIETLKRNIERAGFVEKSKVVRTDAFKAAPMFGSGEKDYGLVFVDPPYAASKNCRCKDRPRGIPARSVRAVSDNGATPMGNDGRDYPDQKRNAIGDSLKRNTQYAIPEE
ncbi:MAG: RsmD family RNA methyltransferase [Planctomycetota bacterium]|jgi:16S rRNA (guanine(966)-N(2))-methyltransferase RsmD